MTERATTDVENVKLIVFACEAGMGSSLMGANQLKKMVKKAKLTEITVVHSPVGQLTTDADIIVVHKGLAQQAHQKIPDAVIVQFDLFMNDPAVKKLVEQLKAGETIVSAL